MSAVAGEIDNSTLYGEGSCQSDGRKHGNDYDHRAVRCFLPFFSNASIVGVDFDWKTLVPVSYTFNTVSHIPGDQWYRTCRLPEEL